MPTAMVPTRFWRTSSPVGMLATWPAGAPTTGRETVPTSCPSWAYGPYWTDRIAAG